MYTMPDTKVTVTFIEKPVTEKYAPLFYSAGGGSGRMASLNAGNSELLDLGGGGINLGFSYALAAQKCKLYATRHHDLLAKYKASGTLSQAYDDANPTKFSVIYADRPVTQAAKYNDGLCFVDVFADGLCPHGNANNAAMLYAAPPFGDNYASETDFLAAIRATGANIAATMGRYNTLAASNSMPSMEVLRLCLYSSAIYNQKFSADPNDIAKNIYDGLHDALKTDDCGLTSLEFPWSADPNDPLFASVRHKFASA